MLDVFVAENRDEIIRRCRSKVALRSMPRPLPAEVTFGVPCFLDQLVEVLRRQVRVGADGIGTSAARHGHDLHLQGFTISQVVRGYGDICQAVTELALERATPISVQEFGTLNRCLDDAIASAVTEYQRAEGRGDACSDVEQQAFFAHEIRNLVGTACIAFEVLSARNTGVGDSTGRALQRSLAGLRDLIHGSVDHAPMRPGAGGAARRSLPGPVVPARPVPRR